MCFTDKLEWRCAQEATKRRLAKHHALHAEHVMIVFRFHCFCFGGCKFLTVVELHSTAIEKRQAEALFRVCTQLAWSGTTPL